MQHECILDRSCVLLSLEWHGKQTRRFVYDDERIVFVDNRQLSGTRDAQRLPARTAWAIGPESDAIGDDEPSGGVGGRGLLVIDEDAAARERVGCPAPRSHPTRCGEVLVE